MIMAPCAIPYSLMKRENDGVYQVIFRSKFCFSVYSTALAKTVSEIRARNAESPFPDSRVGTPIDLGVSQQQNGHGNGFYTATPSRLANPRYDDLPPTPTPTFRRAPSQGW
ncbi:Protein CBG20438 [Caenorhabditis briggsae]|uniref:Protein CBG20438 n=1 Tax=Caenorhabditis briggsae TaxID=6238 RepID=A8XXU3_CAEBR|nr:Protein CBG20438 [Caenorhabditis briggsae]CAP37462.2 Protein CBG20438 [Caenorhabditis briggsae]